MSVVTEPTKLTPMMRQWHEAKMQHEDAILLFRMGDFYELFDQDAIVAAPILELTLTSRDKDKAGLKMAGFPFHAAESYIGKLIEHGHKVAVCEQLEDPKQKVGVVRRGITNVITPGTALEYESSGSSESAFLLSMAVDGDRYSLCALDYTSATFRVTHSTNKQALFDEALRYAPCEIVLSLDDKEAKILAHQLRDARQNRVRVEERRIARVSSSDFAQISLDVLEQKAVALILAYVQELKGHVPSHIANPQRYSIDEQLLIDDATRQNLNLIPKAKADTWNLFSVLDDNKTAMGKRALLQIIKAPLTNVQEIKERQELVCSLYTDHDMRKKVREQLGRFYDLEKLVALMASDKISPRGLAHVRECLAALREITLLSGQGNNPQLRQLLESLPSVEPLYQRLSHELELEPPLWAKDGGIFKPGVFLELDEQKDVMANGQGMLLELEARERQRTGIGSLKIKFTRVFGYYIEITKTNLDKVPPDYIRKQTIANGERYTTDELRLLESKISSAGSLVQSFEEAKFQELCAYAKTFVGILMPIAKQIAYLDNCTSHAEVALRNHFVRPIIEEQDVYITDIKGGWHPIAAEQCKKEGSYFVPNDVSLDATRCSLMLITGPNMAGKSTIMRQVALIQIMAQIGSFVPAQAARLSICDALFARVGASDDMATKRSTFMVEMTETASILHNATRSSLIILDEIGRGTSTYDGLSIAQAVLEHIHDSVKSRTLFATHYHELTMLEGRCERLKNHHVAIDENDDAISFLYTLVQGPCLRSFGIEVARLSGLPSDVLKRAQEILLGLESEAYSSKNTQVSEEPGLFLQQRSLFGVAKNIGEQDHVVDLVDKILGVDINKTTPLQALNKLAAWQRLVQKR